MATRPTALKPGQLRATHYQLTTGGDWTALSNGPIFYRSNFDGIGGSIKIMVGAAMVRAAGVRLDSLTGQYEFAGGKWVGDPPPEAAPAPIKKGPMSLEQALAANRISTASIDLVMVRTGWDMAQWAAKQ